MKIPSIECSSAHRHVGALALFAYIAAAVGAIGTGCAATPAMMIRDAPVAVMATTSTTLAGGHAYWTSDSLVIEMRIAGTSCTASPPVAGDVIVSITVPRALAVPGETPVESDILRNDDVDVAVTAGSRL